MGFSIPNFDSVLAYYAEKTYLRRLEYYLKKNDPKEAKDLAMDDTYDDVLGVAEMIEYKINCVNNALGQTPFVTISFGLDKTKFGRMVSKAILQTRMNKMGENKLTAIFPKLIFLHREEINGAENSPNYDLKSMAIKCSQDNQYPDFLSLDAGYLKEVYDRCGEAITAMGKCA